MTAVLRCVMATVVALVSVTIALFLYAGYAYVPFFLSRLESRRVADACSLVKPGVDFSRTTRILHDHASYWYEYGDFTRNEYTYSGEGGTCVVRFDERTNLVTQAKYEQPAAIHQAVTPE
jgi:hypothetical protein